MNSPSAAQLLAGRGVLVTRPAHQSARLAQAIADAGGHPILYPTIEIADVEDPRGLAQVIDRLDQFDLAVFISPNAVNRAMKLIAQQRSLPPHLAIAAIGSGGVRELNACGVTRVIAPQRHDSEALLDLPQMQDVAGKRIVVFRGQGGRALLADTLAARGAQITHAECYRRGRPQADAAPLAASWQRGELHAVTATSSEGLRNLVEMVGGVEHTWLRQAPLFVPHPRIVQSALALGLSEVVRTAHGDEGLLEGLVRYFAERR